MQRIITFLSILALLVTILSKSVSAAGTSVEGFIKDAETGEPLFGANVMLTGTSMGAATGMDGKYVIPNVPAGAYTIQVTYIGYIEQKVEIKVKEGITVKQDFRLKAVGVKGETVIVTAQASGQQQAINQQLTSDNIVNVVSAAKIQELPDANAAESIGRLPGVSLLRSGGEANEVVIRGLAPKFNRILVDGVQLTSSNPNDESVDLSMISSNMLEGMKVSETVTPDMSAEVIGGVVDMELRQAQVKEPGVPEFNLLAQGGYNGLSNAYNKFNNYKYVAGVQDRLFDSKFGIFAQIDIERRNLPSNQLGATYTNDGDLVPHYFTQSLNLDNFARDRQRYDGAVVLDYVLPAGSLKFSNFLSTGTTDQQDRGESFVLTGSLGNELNTSLASTTSTLSVITNSLNLDYQLPIFHIKAAFSHAYTETKDPNDWTVTFVQQSAFLHSFNPNAPDLNPEIIPNQVNYDPGTTYLNSVASTNSFSSARALTASLDLDANANLSDEITSVIKFGGMYRYQTRSYIYNTTGTQGLYQGSATYVDELIEQHFPSLASSYGTVQIPVTSFIDPSYSYGTFLNGNYTMKNPLNYAMISDMANYVHTNAVSSLGYFHDQFNSTTNNYNGDENQSAGYVMATINIGPQITLIPGVRYQNLQTTYTGTQGIESTSSSLGGSYNHYDTTITENHGFWLPDVSLKYKPLDWLDVRFSYTNTLAYPDYNAIIPRIDVSQTGNLYYNNYDLVPSRSTNYDLNFSIFDNTIGLLTIGGFLKQINNLIYPYDFYVLNPTEALQYYPPRLVAGAQPPTGNVHVFTYVNDPNRATDYGLELSWQTYLWYLPKPFDGLVLDVNYTHVFSKETYPYSKLVNIGTQRSPVYVGVDTSYTSSLLYQPNNMGNLSIGYDYLGFSIRASVIYQDYIFSSTNFYPQLRTNTSAYTRWDLSAKQDLPWLGAQIYGDLSNLNSENDVQVIQAPTGAPQAEQDYGMTIDLGIRVKL